MGTRWKRYSFVGGRPPLMRGNEGPAVVGGGWATPADKLTSERKFRPLRGRSTILRLFTTCPRLPLSVLSSDASSFTVTVSASVPGSSTNFPPTPSPFPIPTFSRTQPLHPLPSTP